MASETVEFKTTAVVDAVEKLRAMGMAQYASKTITRGPRKGQVEYTQSPEQRAAQKHIYMEMARTESKLLANRLDLQMEEMPTGMFKFSKYPRYMGELDWPAVDLAFQYFTNSGIMADAKAHDVEVSREDRAGRMASVFESDAVWQVGGNIQINPEALVA